MASVTKEARTNNGELAWVEALIHDPIAPLLCLLHTCGDDVDPTVSLLCDDVKSLVTDAI